MTDDFRVQPVTPEMARHDIAEHLQSCPDSLREIQICPCWQTAIHVCTACHEVLFLSFSPESGGIPCDHVRTLTERPPNDP